MPDCINTRKTDLEVCTSKVYNIVGMMKNANSFTVFHDPAAAAQTESQVEISSPSPIKTIPESTPASAIWCLP